MPQLDPSTFSTQVLWLVLTFVPLYLILLKVALPRISSVLEQRQDHVDDMLERAATLKNEAAEVLAQYEAALDGARTEAQKRLKATSDELAAEASKRHEAFGKELAARTKEAEARIAKAKAEAIGNLRSVAAEVAASATAKLINVKVADDQVTKAVDAAMGKAG